MYKTSFYRILCLVAIIFFINMVYAQKKILHKSQKSYDPSVSLPLLTYDEKSNTGFASFMFSMSDANDYLVEHNSSPVVLNMCLLNIVPDMELIGGEFSDVFDFQYDRKHNCITATQSADLVRSYSGDLLLQFSNISTNHLNEKTKIGFMVNIVPGMTMIAANDTNNDHVNLFMEMGDLLVNNEVEDDAIADNALQSASIKPNPALNMIEISLPSEMKRVGMTITDLTGQLVAKNRSVSDRDKIDIGHLEEGGYLIQLNHDTSSKVVRLIKIK